MGLCIYWVCGFIAITYIVFNKIWSFGCKTAIKDDTNATESPKGVIIVNIIASIFFFTHFSTHLSILRNYGEVEPFVFLENWSRRLSIIVAEIVVTSLNLEVQVTRCKKKQRFGLTCEFTMVNFNFAFRLYFVLLKMCPHFRMNKNNGDLLLFKSRKKNNWFYSIY